MAASVALEVLIEDEVVSVLADKFDAACRCRGSEPCFFNAIVVMVAQCQEWSQGCSLIADNFCLFFFLVFRRISVCK